MKKSKLFIVVLLIAIGQLTAIDCFAQFTKLLDLTGAANGSYPEGSLISDGTYLFGMAKSGGSKDSGVIFRIKPDGTGYMKLLDFTGVANGSNPEGSLLLEGSFLYGMTRNGGTNNKGTIFKIKADGTGFTKLLDFSGTANGQSPYGSLIYDGNFLYGTAYGGGINNLGTIFKIKPDGTGFTKIWDCALATGSNPWSSLVTDGTFLYGTTYGGGTKFFGTIFKIKPDGTGFTKLLDFLGDDNGKWQKGSLIFDGTFLYGLTLQGGTGTNHQGVIYKIRPDGTGFTKLREFSGSPDGSRPNGALLSVGNYLYGATQSSGTNDFGTLFRIKPDGTDYSKLLDMFNTATGDGPNGPLITDGTFLYGMATAGGSQYKGAVFKYKIPTIGVNKVDFQNPQFGIYPNPANGAFTVSASSNSQTSNRHYQVSIINVFGQTLEAKTFRGNISFETSTWAKGIYFVDLKDENGVRVGMKKVIIE